jgi:hypothetical protein
MPNIVVRFDGSTSSGTEPYSTDDVRSGADELGVDFDEHVRFVVAALEEHAGELQIDGESAAAA